MAINDACRTSGTRFIMTDTFGLFGSIFCDFGDEFEVSDVNGEEPMTSLLSSVSAEEKGLVTVYDEGRHGLEDGDYVTFTEVGGMVELNGCEPVPVTVTGPYTVRAHAQRRTRTRRVAPGMCVRSALHASLPPTAPLDCGSSPSATRAPSARTPTAGTYTRSSRRRRSRSSRSGSRSPTRSS